MGFFSALRTPALSLRATYEEFFGGGGRAARDADHPSAPLSELAGERLLGTQI